MLKLDGAKIRIKNFKKLEDVELELKSKTFLLGPNNSGKSTLMKALMFFSINAFNKGEIEYKISDDIDLGSFKEIISENNEAKVLSISIEAEFEFMERVLVNARNKSDIPKEQLLKILEECIKIKVESERFLAYFWLFNSRIAFELNTSVWLHIDRICPTIDIFANNEYWEAAISESVVGFQESIFNTFKIEMKIYKKLNKYFIETQIITPSFDKLLIKRAKNGNTYELSLNEKNHSFTEKSFKNLLKDIFTTDFDISSKAFQKAKSVLNGFLPRAVKSEAKKLNSYVRILSLLGINDYIFSTGKNKLINISLFPSVRELPKQKYESKELNNIYYGIITRLKSKKEAELIELISKNFEMQESEHGDLRIYYSTTLTFAEYKKLRSLLSGRIIQFNCDKSELEVQIKDGYKIFAQNGDKYHLKKHIDKLRMIKVDLQNSKTVHKLETINFPNFADYNNKKVFYIIESSQLGLASGDYQQQLNLFFWLKESGLGGVVWCEENENFVSIMLKTESGAIINIANTSSGFQQIFPIYCSDFNFNSDQFYYSVSQTNNVVIQQPELHLHPRVQAKLADFFLSTSSAVLVETHSEHLIRKLQVLTAQNPYVRKKISILYFQDTPKGTKITELPMDENGNFTVPWPDGFFDDSTKLSYDLLEAQIKRAKNAADSN